MVNEQQIQGSDDETVQQQAADNHRDRLADVTLLYLNRDPRSAAYLAELSRRRPGFRLVLSMTRHEGWAGETERFGHGLLGRLVDDISGCDYYVVGTTGMVDTAVATLRDAGANPGRIHDEDFSGYE